MFPVVPAAAGGLDVMDAAPEEDCTALPGTRDWFVPSAADRPMVEGDPRLAPPVVGGGEGDSVGAPAPVPRADQRTRWSGTMFLDSIFWRSRGDTAQAGIGCAFPVGRICWTIATMSVD